MANRYQPELDRLLANVHQLPNGCWEWTAYVNPEGYARTGFRGKSGVNAHRATYTILVGPIPVDMTLDHDCHNKDETCTDGPACRHRRCVNPQHVVVVTRGQNTLSGRTSAVLNAAKTRCVNNHEFTEANTIRRPDGRRCRECSRAAGRRYDNTRRGNRHAAA